MASLKRWLRKFTVNFVFREISRDFREIFANISRDFREIFARFSRDFRDIFANIFAIFVAAASAGASAFGRRLGGNGHDVKLWAVRGVQLFAV